jgi:hypothetical protein
MKYDVGNGKQRYIKLWYKTLLIDLNSSRLKSAKNALPYQPMETPEINVRPYA